MGTPNRKIAAGIAAAIAAVVVISCAGPEFRKPREAWRNRVEASCLRAGYIQPSTYIRQMPAIDGPGSCGAKRPFSISVAPASRVGLKPAATMACPVASAVDGWLLNDVQSAAADHFGEPVVQIDVAASYSCRTRNSVPGAKVSEHAYANALDVSGFRLMSGRQVKVKSGWRGSPDEASFLRAVHRGACRRFKTIIGPDGDRHHQDHLHLDLAWHNKDGTYVYCK